MEKNVRVELVGRKLRFEVDLEAEVGPSPRHPETAIIVASSGGWRVVEEDRRYSFSLAVTRRKNGKEYRGRV